MKKGVKETLSAAEKAALRTLNDPENVIQALAD